MNTKNHTPKLWKTLSEKLIAPCRVFDLYEKHMQHPSGKTGNFYMVKAPDWVHVLPLTSDNHLILVQQFRFGIDELCWEAPGGIIDPNELPLTAGIRELQEETGYTGSNPQIIGSCHANPGMLNNRSHFVLIENCTQTSETNWDHHEELAIMSIPLDQAYQMVKSGQIQHSVTITALLYLKLHLDL